MYLLTMLLRIARKSRKRCFQNGDGSPFMSTLWLKREVSAGKHVLNVRHGNWLDNHLMRFLIRELTLAGPYPSEPSRLGKAALENKWQRDPPL
jgi:hypothetical protein